MVNLFLLYHTARRNLKERGVRKALATVGDKKGDMFMKFGLLIIALLTSITLFADGVQPIGSGTEDDPYQVEILDNLLWISTNISSWSSHYIQTANIDATDTQNWNNGEGFSPIGTCESHNGPLEERFTGKYNGQNYAIDGLHINRPNMNSQGLFGFIDSATIQNIEVSNVNIIGFWYTGGLVGFSYEGSTISNCTISGIISGYRNVGGLVGNNTVSIIQNCTSNTEVSCIEDCVGGLVGANIIASILNCSSIGNVNGNEDVGGLVGQSDDLAIIRNCFSTCNVNGNDNVGGIAGINSDALLTNSYSTGNVTGDYQVGGFVGYNYFSDIINCYSRSSVDGYNVVGGMVGSNSGDIYSSYSTGSVQGDYHVGGFLGYYDGGSTNDSFWDIETSGVNASEGGTGKTTFEMNDLATFTSLNTIGLNTPWDFVNNPFDDIENYDYWDIAPTNNDGYPFFANPYVNIENYTIQLPSATLFNYPNPFNPSTTIKFSIQYDSEVELSVFNIKGQKIKTMVQNEFTNGIHTIIWNGVDDNGKSVSSGIYYYKLNINGNPVVVNKCLLLK